MRQHGISLTDGRIFRCPDTQRPGVKLGPVFVDGLSAETQVMKIRNAVEDMGPSLITADKIGRASGRERVEVSGGAGSCKKKS